MISKFSLNSLINRYNLILQDLIYFSQSVTSWYLRLMDSAVKSVRNARLIKYSILIGRRFFESKILCGQGVLKKLECSKMINYEQLCFEMLF